MNGAQHNAFSQLLAAWRRHEESRDTHEIQQLAEARFALDSARAQMRSTMSSSR